MEKTTWLICTMECIVILMLTGPDQRQNLGQNLESFSNYWNHRCNLHLLSKITISFCITVWPRQCYPQHNRVMALRENGIYCIVDTFTKVGSLVIELKPQIIVLHPKLLIRKNLMLLACQQWQFSRSQHLQWVFYLRFRGRALQPHTLQFVENWS